MFSAKRSEFERRGGYLQILGDLGVTERRIREALVLGIRTYHARVDGLPASFAGSIPTAHAKASLARALGAVGEETAGEASDRLWRDDDWRLKTVAAKGAEAFSVKFWLGDEDTGLEAGLPRPRGTKGAETQDEVNRNHSQRGLFDDLPEEDQRRIFQIRGEEGPDGRVFGVVLYRYEIKDDRCLIYSELSVPDGYDEQARTITEWAHRTIFPPIFVDLRPDVGETYDEGEDFDPDLGRD